jgi:hypothetical protein
MMKKNLMRPLLLLPRAHKSGERGTRWQGKTSKNKHKPKPRAKSQECATMVKRFGHLKNNLMMIVTTFAACT